MKIRAFVTVKGVVQGVSLRYYTHQTALSLNVTGWVRNLQDGSVEGCFEGEEQPVERLIEWCRKGSERAKVDEVMVEGTFCTGELCEFEIRR